MTIRTVCIFEPFEHPLSRETAKAAVPFGMRRRFARVLKQKTAEGNPDAPALEVYAQPPGQKAALLVNAGDP
jgi:hypothetical protein